jgi:hypothetical protein
VVGGAAQPAGLREGAGVGRAAHWPRGVGVGEDGLGVEEGGAAQAPGAVEGGAAAG